jgi:hypothetical protein
MADARPNLAPGDAFDSSIADILRFHLDKKMKKACLYKILTGVWVIGAACLWALPANGAQQQAWPQPPNLVLQRCIAAKQSVNHNPFSTFSNDFFVITTYEEDGSKGAFQADENGPSTGNPSPALDVYLVVRIFLDENRPAPIIHDAALVVTEKNMVLHGDRKPIARRWILLDVDGDGTVDKLIFSQSLKEPESPSHEVKIPASRIRELQG